MPLYDINMNYQPLLPYVGRLILPLWQPGHPLGLDAVVLGVEALVLRSCCDFVEQYQCLGLKSNHCQPGSCVLVPRDRPTRNFSLHRSSSSTKVLTEHHTRNRRRLRSLSMCVCACVLGGWPKICAVHDWRPLPDRRHMSWPSCVATFLLRNRSSRSCSANRSHCPRSCRSFTGTRCHLPAPRVGRAKKRECPPGLEENPRRRLAAAWREFGEEESRQRVQLPKIDTHGTGRVREGACGLSPKMANREAQCGWRLHSLMAVDITSRCALRSCGTAHLHTAATNGAVLAGAREVEERKYVELLDAERCRLVVIALGPMEQRSSAFCGLFGLRPCTGSTGSVVTFSALEVATPLLLDALGLLRQGLRGFFCRPSSHSAPCDARPGRPLHRVKRRWGVITVCRGAFQQ